MLPARGELNEGNGYAQKISAVFCPASGSYRSLIGIGEKRHTSKPSYIEPAHSA